MTLRELIVKDVTMFVADGELVVTAAKVARTLRRSSPSVRAAMNELARTGLLKKTANGYTLPHIKLRGKRATPAVVDMPPTPVVPVPIGEPVASDEPLADPEMGDEPFMDEDEDTTINGDDDGVDWDDEDE